MLTEILFFSGAIFLLIILSGLFSGSETALTATSPSRIHRMAKGGNRRAALVERLTGDAERLIGAILLGNNLVNILASALATAFFIRLFGQLGVLYATVAMTLLVLIFAEVLPKTYAISNPERMALRVAPFVRLVVFLFSPFVSMVQWVVRTTLRLFGVDISGEQILSAHDEIRGAISLQAHEGGLIKNSKDMLDSILDLQDVQLEDVMVHRKNVEMINAEDSTDEIFTQVVQSPFTRLPLWRDNPDNIIGIIHAKEVLRAVKDNNGSVEGLDFLQVAQEPWFVPETTSLQEQLSKFLSEKSHFALVVDEYGAFMGVTTLEDILEEIVGDIYDEHDTSSSDVQILQNGGIITSGDTPLRDLNRQFNWELDDEIVTTIAGYVIDIAETIPLPGQKFNHNGFGFEILKRRRNQVTSILITPPGRPKHSPKS
ncbi:HlyC/CorC family transporter [Paremcibacter congregatus]|uniref:HlyC/CorC family transporter n=1 Tax=Paremcibacter congregatus TaxID=2043170 RepID=UPI0015E39562|nr:HlyC/CorC family transporter [Paremcibacter congregatus]